MTKPNWKPIQIRLGDLIPWGDNPKYSTREDARRLLETEQEFGQFQTFSVSPYIDGSKVNCYDGHQRDSAWRTAYGDDFVVWALQSDRHLTEAERKRFVLRAHNAHGQWSSDMLAGWGADELKGGWFDNNTLKTWKADVTWLGEFLKSEAPAVDAEPQTDKGEELRAKWGVELGQIWELGDHRIICGDSTDVTVYERLMQGEKARLCHTDPPYGVDYANVVGGRANQKAGGWKDIENDALDNAELEEFLVKALQLTDAPVLLCWHSWRRVEVFLSAIKRCGWTPNAEIIWVKNALVFGMSDYQWRHETCIYAKREGAGRQENRKETTVWEFDKTVGAMHPTQKPIGLFEKGLENHTQIGDIVYEPFSGSGSQLVACENLRRRCRAIEISPAYVAVALERMATAFPHLDIRRVE